MQTKNELRKQLMQQLAVLSADQIEQASRAVAKKALTQLDWSKVRTILAYEPLPGLGEIDPAYLLEKLQDRQIDFVAATKNAPFPSKQYDVIIVPVLGFDDDNHRLGRGGGWYDRFLVHHTQAITLGLAHDFTKVTGLQNEKHDIGLRIIVTS